MHSPAGFPDASIGVVFSYFFAIKKVRRDFLYLRCGMRRIIV